MEIFFFAMYNRTFWPQFVALFMHCQINANLLYFSNGPKWPVSPIIWRRYFGFKELQKLIWAGDKQWDLKKHLRNKLKVILLAKETRTMTCLQRINLCYFPILACYAPGSQGGGQVWGFTFYLLVLLVPILWSRETYRYIMDIQYYMLSVFYSYLGIL